LSPSNNLNLDISKNNIGPRGGAAIAGVIAGLNLNTLNISDTSLGDDGLLPLIQSIYNNESISDLNISNNFATKTTKTRTDLIFSLSQMCGSSVLPLQSLTMRGDNTKNRLRESLSTFFQGLDKNNTLEVLDVSGQGMGNRGAIALSKLLIVNNYLSEVHLDDNQITVLGLLNIKEALESNPVKRFVALPIQDIVRALSESQENKVLLLDTVLAMQKPKQQFQ